MAQTQIQGEQLKDLTVNTADIADNAVTLAKMAQMSTANVLGRNTAGMGNVESISMATLKSMLSIPAGSDSQIQVNLSGVLGTDSRFTFDVLNGLLSTGLGIYGTDGSMTVASFTSMYPQLILDDNQILLNYDGDSGAYLSLASSNYNYNAVLAAGHPTIGDASGGYIQILGGKGFGLGVGGYVQLLSGNGSASGGSNAGHVFVTAGSAESGNGIGGSVSLTPGTGFGSGANGRVILVEPSNGKKAIMDTSYLMTSDKTFTFPNASGTFALLSTANNFTAINTFSNTTDSSSTTTGALIVSGGVGIAKALSVGTTAAIGGSAISSIALRSILTGANAGAAIYGVDSELTINNTTTNAFGVYTKTSTAAASFTLLNTYGVYIASGTVGAGSTRANQIGLYIENMDDYAIQTGTGLNYFGDYTTIINGLEVQGTVINNGTTAFGNSSGINASYALMLVHNFSAGGDVAGVYSFPEVSAAATSMAGVKVLTATIAGSYTLTDNYGMYISEASKGAGVTVTNDYGIYIGNVANGGTKNYAIYTNNGLVRFGDNTAVGGDAYANVKLGVRGTVTGNFGMYLGDLVVDPPNNANAEIIDSRATIATNTSDTVPSAYGIVAGMSKSGSGSITNAYGIFVDNISLASTYNYAIYTNAGMVRFGDAIVQVTTATTNSVLANLNAPSMGNGQSIALVIGKSYSAYNATVLDFMPSATAANSLVGLGMAGIGYGVRIDGNLQVTIPTTTDSTSASTGALAVAGGVGIAKALTVGSVLGVGTVPNAGYGITVAATTMAAFMIVTTALTNSSAQFITYAHRTTGTPADGFGIMIITTLQTTTTYDVANVSEVHSWATAAHATRKGLFIKYVYDTAGREVMRGSTNGSAPTIGFLGAGAVARQAVGNAAPAGGTGTAAGGYDTAANRNAMITLVNNMRTALINLGLCSA